jgi:hypothetical protein
VRRLLAGLLVLAAACGTGDGGVTVLAAASLNEAFAELGGATFSFAGSQQLSALDNVAYGLRAGARRGPTAAGGPPVGWSDSGSTPATLKATGVDVYPA